MPAYMLVSIFPYRAPHKSAMPEQYSHPFLTIFTKQKMMRPSTIEWDERSLGLANLRYSEHCALCSGPLHHLVSGPGTSDNTLPPLSGPFLIITVLSSNFHGQIR